MILKTQTIFKRTVRRGKPDYHTERGIRSTWWLLWVIPIFSTEHITHHNL